MDIVIVLVFLSLLAVAPLLLAVGTHERRLAQRALLRRAMIDTLTGLPNSTAFEDALRAQLEQLTAMPVHNGDRTRVVLGKRVYLRVDIGGRRARRSKITSLLINN